MTWQKSRPSEYVILYRKEDSAAGDAVYRVLVGQKQAMSFEAILALLDDERRSSSLRSLLQPTYRLVLADNGSVLGHKELGTRLLGTIMPLGGQWCFPGGRDWNGPGGLAKALREICIDSMVAASITSISSSDAYI